MGDFIYFTEEQKERANAVPIMDILKREHEEVERSGNEEELLYTVYKEIQ